jgi:enoyl-CoA hydratase/carnithine racemase
LKHYHAFIETVRRMPKIVLSSVHGSAAGAGMGLAFVTDLCIAAEDARFTPAYAKIGVSPDGGSTGRLWSAPSAPAARCSCFSPKTVFPRSRPTIGVWSRALFRRQN